MTAYFLTLKFKPMILNATRKSRSWSHIGEHAIIITHGTVYKYMYIVTANISGKEQVNMTPFTMTNQVCLQV